MGCEPSYLYPRLNADEVYLQVVVLFQHIDNGLLLCREVRKERPLYALPLGFHQFGIVLPPHVFHKVFCRCDECSAIAAYQVVASLAVHIAYASRKGKDIAVVSLRYFGGDQSSTLAALSTRIQASDMPATIRLRLTKLILSALVWVRNSVSSPP